MSWIVWIFWAYCAFIGVRLTHLLIRYIALSLDRPGDIANTPPVSVIVCTRNEEHNIEELIPILLTQDYPNYELIVVLDRCGDNSLEIVKSWEQKDERFKSVIVDYLPDQFSPKKFGLTLSAKGASHEWLLFTDADCRPSSDQWIRSMATQMTDNHDFVLGYAPYYAGHSLLNHFISYETFETGVAYLSSARLKNPYMGVGRNLGYRKSLFLEVKGFNRFQGIMGGDDDLFVQHHAKPNRTAVALGYESLMYSAPELTLSSYWVQKKRHYSVSKFYKAVSKIKHSLKSVVLLSLWVTFTILALMNHQPEIIYPVIGFYLVAIVLMNNSLTKKLGEGYSLWLTPILEWMYVLFIPVSVLASLFTKKVKWK
ncbi:MAG: glycosyltransferase [Cyclobacteriaceae bacterium]